MTTCPHCAQPLSRDGHCSFCPGLPSRLYSATRAVHRYFVFLGRSPAPALDPSQESTHGGAVPPISICLHEGARLGAVLEVALGAGWLSSETGRALIAILTDGDWRYRNWLQNMGKEQRGEWDRLCRVALGKIRDELERRGLLEEREEQEEEVREEIVQGWREIADELDVSIDTLRKWYNGPENEDPCGIQQAITKVGRLVKIRRSDLEACWEKLYPKKMDTAQESI